MVEERSLGSPLKSKWVHVQLTLLVWLIGMTHFIDRHFTDVNSPISWLCRSDIEIFFDWVMSFFQLFDSHEKIVCKMGPTSHAEFISVTG